MADTQKRLFEEEEDLFQGREKDSERVLENGFFIESASILGLHRLKLTEASKASPDLDPLKLRSTRSPLSLLVFPASSSERWKLSRLQGRHVIVC